MNTDVKTIDDLQAVLDRIMGDLEAATNELPEDAIRSARKHRDHIIPRLVRAIQAATAQAASGDTPQGNAHFFALFLLTEFRAKEALPAILEAISLPGELPFDLFGDSITESLSQVLAELAGDSPEILDALIRNPLLNEYVRWEAAETYRYLVRDGGLSRDDAVDRLRCHLREAIANEDPDIVVGLILALTSFAPHEAESEIQEAFRLDLVDESVVDIEFVHESISEGDSRFQKELERCRPTGIQDTVDVLKTWHAFSDEKKTASKMAIYQTPWEADQAIDDAPITIRNTRPDVRRNDPCPCGSGKKFKKCCGAR